MQNCFGILRLLHNLRLEAFHTVHLRLCTQLSLGKGLLSELNDTEKLLIIKCSPFLSIDSHGTSNISIIVIALHTTNCLDHCFTYFLFICITVVLTILLFFFKKNISND